MKRLSKKLLSVILSITVIIGVFPLNHVFAVVPLYDVDEPSSISIDLEESVNKFMDNADKAIDSASKNVGAAGDVAKTAAQTVSTFAQIMTGVGYISTAFTLFNGVVTFLRTMGVIEDPVQTKLDNILKVVNELKDEVKKINEKVTKVQNTLESEFSNTQFELNKILANQYKTNWSNFLSVEYKNMTDLFDAYQNQVNTSAMEWAKTWSTGSKTDLRCLYNRQGDLLCSGNNYDFESRENYYLASGLKSIPKNSDDGTSTTNFNSAVNFGIILPAEYLTLDASELNIDTYIETVRKTVLAGVKKALKDKKIDIDFNRLTSWTKNNITSEDDIAAKITDDMVNSMFYSISSKISNSAYDKANNFANKTILTYNALCDAINGSTGRNSAVEDIMDNLKLTYAFEGDVKDYALEFYTMVGMAVIQYGSFVSTLASMNPNITSAKKEQLAATILDTVKKNNSIYETFLTGNNNYCYPLNGILSYVDVKAQNVIKSHNEERYEGGSGWADKYNTFSDWAIIDASIDFDTADMDAYKLETKKNEAVLKNSMQGTRNLQYLYHFINALGYSEDVIAYLKKNGVISTDGDHSTILVTPEFEVKNQPLDSTLLKSFPYGNDFMDTEYCDDTVEKGYEEGKSVKAALINKNEYEAPVHNKLVAKTFSIGSKAPDGMEIDDIASRITEETTLATLVYQFEEHGYVGPRYLLHDDAVVTLDVTEDAVIEDDIFETSPYRSVYTATVEKTYGALALNYNVNADTYSYDYVIEKKDDLTKFLKNIADGNTYEGKNIIMKNDIDMEGVNPADFWSNSDYKKEFKGHFNGNNKTISNFSFTSTEHRVGLFRTTGSGAFIENLKFKNVTINSSASKNGYAALVGFANGKLTVKNVEIISGFISGYKYVGGIVGESNEGIKLTVLNCTNNAEIRSFDTDAGGMLGNVGEFYIYGCVNNGKVTANKGGAAGMVGYTNKASAVKNSKNTGEIAGYDCAGGMCGRIDSDTRFTRFTGNENTGKITATAKGSAGGITGWTNGGGAYIDNRNSGAVVCNATEKSHQAGGILGGNEDDPILFKNNTNSGSVKGNDRAGGIAGYLGDKDHDKLVVATNNTNSGTISTTGKDAGGIIGCLLTDNTHHNISFNTNTGSISGKACAGGIVGWMAGGGTLEGNTNKADILSLESDAGGIVGAIEDDKCEFKNSTVDGKTMIGDQRMILDADYLIKTKNSSKHAGKICGWDGKRKTSIDSDTLFATIFGQGNIIVIAIMAVLLIAAAVIIILVYRKKKKAAEAAKAN